MNCHIRKCHTLPNETKTNPTNSDPLKLDNGEKISIKTALQFVHLGDRVIDSRDKTWEQNLVEEPIIFQYVCKECGKKFNQEQNLRNHLKEIHNKTIKCEECGKEFINSIKLNRHLRSIHGIEPRRRKKSILDPKDLTCTICAKTMKTKGAFQVHMESHGEKKYICENCGAAFSSRHNFDYHCKTQHSGSLNTINCKICNLKFASFREVILHRKTLHTPGITIYIY